MHVIIDFFRLIRIKNLVIILLTQLFAYYFLTPTIHLGNLLETEFLFLISCTVLVAAAGYIINDYMDVMLDLVNKPEKVIVGKTIPRRWAMLLHFACSISAFIMAWSINKKVALMVLLCSLSLWIYSQLLKKTYLTGNILVALLTSFTLWIIYVYNHNVNGAGIWVYSIFAFATTLLREIIKDTEDLRGDQKFKCRTLPIVVGIRKTKKVLIWIQSILIILTFVYCSFFAALSYSSSNVNMMFLMYMAGFVILPMFLMLWLINTADVKNDFSKLSILSKVIMLSGIMSMVFWRF
ncbi:MAG: geranylgeranylglycerol-phosphate geranylgeranyltransferase [Bacteroidota bacterium]|nr:geranylgeranylglycerol-phosphate geranylgeranyltransferase [Bacteroidota bacterium]